MSKRRAETDTKHQFNEQWEDEFLFILGPSGKPLCLVCESILSDKRRHDLNRHYKTIRPKYGRNIYLRKKRK